MFICKKTITQLCRNSLNPIPIIGSFVQLNLHFVKINFPHSCREKSVWGPDWVHVKGGLSCGGETVVGMQHNNTHIIPPLLNTLYSTLNKILTKEGFLSITKSNRDAFFPFNNWKWWWNIRQLFPVKRRKMNFSEFH